MPVIILAAVAAIVAEPSADFSLAWLHRPTARDIALCAPRSLPRGQYSADLGCQTAERDRIGNCRVIGVSGYADAKVERHVEQTALCAAKYFRIRAINSRAGTYIGAPVFIPMVFSLHESGSHAAHSAQRGEGF